MEEFLTVDEIAHTVKLNAQTVGNYIDRGELPSVRIGGRRVRVKKADLETFVGTEIDLSHPATHAPSEDATTAPDPPSTLEMERLELRDEELIAALRAFGEAAMRLAEALERRD